MPLFDCFLIDWIILRKVSKFEYLCLSTSIFNQRSGDTYSSILVPLYNSVLRLLNNLLCRVKNRPEVKETDVLKEKKNLCSITSRYNTLIFLSGIITTQTRSVRLIILPQDP